MNDLRSRFNKEFDELCRSKREIVLKLTSLQAWVLMVQLQLALRHPLNHGATSKSAQELARLLQRTVAPAGALAEAAEKGWRPEEDYVPPPISRCRVCGCTDDDCRQCMAKTGQPCHWVEPDLCSACADEKKR